MRLEDIRGQDGAARVLGRAIRTGEVASAYLFSGPPGVGKRSTARAFAAALLCTGAAEAGVPPPCGACPSCRKYAHGVHADFVTVEPAEKKKEIGVDVVRTEVHTHLPFSPYEATRRVFFFPAAEDLSPSAANALLRSMEEPSTYTHFLLVSSEAHRLLPTVRSRCQEVRFLALPDDLVMALLVARDVPADDARRAAAFAGGSVGRALERLGADLGSRVAVAERLEAAAAGSLAKLLDTARDVAKEKDALPDVLEAWLLLRRDVLRAGEGAPEESLLVASDPAAFARRARALSPEARVRGLEAVHEAIVSIERYANPELVLGRALLEIGRTV